MALDIIGVGYGRTGTLSLKLALETIGYAACYHMSEVVGHPEHSALWINAWRGEDPWRLVEFLGFPLPTLPPSLTRMPP